MKRENLDYLHNMLVVKKDLTLKEHAEIDKILKSEYSKSGGKGLVLLRYFKILARVRYRLSVEDHLKPLGLDSMDKCRLYCEKDIQETQVALRELKEDHLESEYCDLIKVSYFKKNYHLPIINKKDVGHFLKYFQAGVCEMIGPAL